MHGVSFSYFRLHFRLLTCSGSDVEIHHLETAQPLKFSKVSVSAPGPLRASVDAEVKYGNSTINLTVSRVAFYKRMSLINIFRFRWMLLQVGISFSIIPVGLF